MDFTGSSSSTADGRGSSSRRPRRGSRDRGGNSNVRADRRAGDDLLECFDMGVVGTSVAGSSSAEAGGSTATGDASSEEPGKHASGTSAAQSAPRIESGRKQFNIGSRNTVSDRERRIYGRGGRRGNRARRHSSSSSNTSHDSQSNSARNNAAVGAISDNFARANQLINGTDTALNALMQQQYDGSSYANITEEEDHGNLWGVGDETDETMQRLLEQSYSQNHQRQNEQDMIEAAIRMSLASASQTSHDKEQSPDATALEQQAIADENEVLEIQVAQLFEHYPEDVAALTLSTYNQLKETHDKKPSKIGIPKPTIDDALAKVLRDTKEKENAQHQVSAADAEFVALQGEYPEETLREARAIYDDLFVKQRDQGGNAPTIDYAISIAQDRAKERVRQTKEKEEREQQAALEEQRAEAERQAEERAAKERQVLEQRRQETREERAARFAAAFDTRNKP